MLRAITLTSILILLLAGTNATAAASPRDALDEFIARTGEIVDQARDVVGESESVPARRVLDEAERMHQQSQSDRDGGRPRQALAASQRARKAAEHAIRLARESRGFDERARVRLERFADLLDQLRDRAREAGDEVALRFVREAEEQGLRAQDHYRQRNFAICLELVDGADALLGRAARLLFEGGGAERLDRELQRTAELIDRIEERASSAASHDLVQSARDALGRAERARADGQILRALQSLRLAARLAGRAAAASGGETVAAESVREQIERWDERHGEVADRIAEADSRDATQTLASARHHREEAQKLLAAGDLEPALRQIKSAFDLLNEASEMIR